MIYLLAKKNDNINYILSISLDGKKLDTAKFFGNINSQSSLYIQEAFIKNDGNLLMYGVLQNSVTSNQEYVLLNVFSTGYAQIIANIGALSNVLISQVGYNFKDNYFFADICQSYTPSNWSKNLTTLYKIDLDNNNKITSKLTTYYNFVSNLVFEPKLNKFLGILQVGGGMFVASYDPNLEATEILMPLEKQNAVAVSRLTLNYETGHLFYVAKADDLDLHIVVTIDYSLRKTVKIAPSKLFFDPVALVSVP
ncbi:hypothetical protein ABK040_013600 [Willaertia magna]